MLSKLFGLGRPRQRPHRSGTIQTGKSRRFVPQLETLETREVLSPALCDNSFAFLVGTNTYKIPYQSNYRLDEPNDDVTRVIVAVHGIDRTAKSTYDDVLNAGQNLAAGADRTSLIVAPQFLNESDIAAYQLGNDYMFWNNGLWRDGGQSSSTVGPHGHFRPDNVSSFEVVDELLNSIVDSHNFSHLDTVIVSGHSAGGQFVQRYAATSHLDLASQGLSVRYVTMNPGTYLYLDEHRWNPSTGTFDIPTGHDGYDNYPYGLGYVDTTLYPYIANLDATTIRSQYAQRQVIYIQGKNDTSTGGALDTSDPAMLEGANRFERGSTYFNYLHYLQDYYGTENLDFRSHVRETVPGVGHDSTGMYASSSALRWLFDYNPQFPRSQCVGTASSAPSKPDASGFSVGPRAASSGTASRANAKPRATRSIETRMCGIDPLIGISSSDDAP